MSAWRVCRAGLCQCATVGGLWQEYLCDNRVAPGFILNSVVLWAYTWGERCVSPGELCCVSIPGSPAYIKYSCFSSATALQKCAQ